MILLSVNYFILFHYVLEKNLRWVKRRALLKRINKRTRGSMSSPTRQINPLFGKRQRLGVMDAKDAASIHLLRDAS